LAVGDMLWVALFFYFLIKIIQKAQDCLWKII